MKDICFLKIFTAWCIVQKVILKMEKFVKNVILNVFLAKIVINVFVANNESIFLKEDVIINAQRVAFLINLIHEKIVQKP